MTDKRNSKTKRAELEERAREIVKGEANDFDARLALLRALHPKNKTADKDLARMTAQAEAGEIVTEPYDEVE